MSSNNIYTELISIANNELDRIEKSLPDDPGTCFVVLLEATRMCDYLSFGPKEEIEKYRLSFQEFDVLQSGWNLTSGILFRSLRQFPGIPMMESNSDTQTSAIGLLYQLGCVTLLKRTAEMVKSGILVSEPTEISNRYSFSMSNDGKAQFLDIMEPTYLENLEKEISESDFYKDWNLFDLDDIEKAAYSFGSFMSKKPGDLFSHLNLDDLESRMYPLIKPWDLGKGIMMGYGSTEELDWHFLAIAINSMVEWRDDAGLHPELDIKGLKVSEIISVVMCLVSFNLKHIKFSSIASERIKEISIFPSLTIWCPLSELIFNISDFTGIKKDTVEKIFEIISFKANDAKLLKNHTSKFMPLIIDMENGFVLRPVSGILRNPLNTVKDLLALREPKWIPEFSKHRESWLRSHLYAMFMGTRYHQVTGNVTLKIGNRFITDVDAAIYDYTTGELALFQLKWQDYHFNDVKKLRSKASNLIKELDRWTKNVSEWISSEGVNQLSKNLRLTSEMQITEAKIYLFGLSRNAARMKGFGFELKESKIAIGTCAQFKRNRTEIGPVESVFGTLFKTLKEQENAEIKIRPRPITFRVADKEFFYKDLWNISES